MANDNSPDNRGVPRRRFLKLGVSGVVVVVVAGVGTYLALQPQPSPAPVATPAPRPSPVPEAPKPTPAPAPTPTLSPPPSIEEAKKEGKVTVYTGFWVSTIDATKKAFEAKYPGITVEYVRGFADLIVRAVSETRAGKHLMDIMLGSYGYALSLFDIDAVATYRSAVDADYPSHLKVHDGVFIINHAGVITITHHKDLPKDMIPQSWQDLLQPKYKGRLIAWDLNQGPYVLPIMEKKVIGPDKWVAWMEALKAQNTKLLPSSSPMITMIANKEADIALWTYISTVRDLAEKGAPVDYVSAQGTVLGEPQGVTINKFAPHPNAARLFRDFAFSEEGVRIIANVGVYAPLRPGVESKIPRIRTEDVILSPPITIKDLEDARAKWNTVFGPK